MQLDTGYLREGKQNSVCFHAERMSVNKLSGGVWYGGGGVCVSGLSGSDYTPRAASGFTH